MGQFEFPARGSRLTLTRAYAKVGNMPKRSSKRPRDVNQLAKLIVDISTGSAPPDPVDTRNPAAVALGSLGGAKGGKARAEKLSAKQRAEIAKKAANIRWNRSKGNP